VNAAIDAGVERFVYLSSAEVYGPNVAGEVRESSDTPQAGNPYADAKVQAEQLCLAAAQRGLLPVVLRPSIIYGPGSASWTVNIAKRLLSGAWGRFEEFGDGLANLVYIDDLAEAILLSLAEPAARGKALNINGPDRVTWNEYFERFNAALGLPPLKSIAPARSRARTLLMDQVGRATDLVRDHFEDRLMDIYLRGGWMSRLMKRIKGKLDATPSSSELTGLYSREARYDDSLARRTLGYHPRVSLDQGLAASVAWLRHQQLAGAEPPCSDDKAAAPLESPPLEAPV
ncbi:MAG: NAD(P)-dependent oxidoreductase, partial [Planctomycetales bacterium]|nr:NAD(P)-dependent oxidoreductase [Planctomycetales bacterium]